MNKHRSKIIRRSIAEQAHHVAKEQFGREVASGHAKAFLLGLGEILKGQELKRFFHFWQEARERRQLRLVMLGGAVIKTGMGPLLSACVREGVISHVAMNGSAAIHDFELALAGKTSENVGQGLVDGSFGMTLETGRDMNLAINAGAERGEGMGEALGRWIVEKGYAHREVSLLAACHEADVPCTVHVALGTDIIHQHPEFDAARTGRATGEDFDRLIEVLAGMGAGACVANLGSAVLMPEVFLKALTVARNTTAGVEGFHTAVFDMQSQYRPLVNVVNRPREAGGGEGFYFIGHHEIMLPPLFRRAVGGWRGK
ncbi:hypothetical protein HS125_09805 [bacterium]|nr:hypothetical protein [bacterium]